MSRVVKIEITSQHVSVCWLLRFNTEKDGRKDVTFFSEHLACRVNSKGDVHKRACGFK